MLAPHDSTGADRRDFPSSKAIDPIGRLSRSFSVERGHFTKLIDTASLARVMEPFDAFRSVDKF